MDLETLLNDPVRRRCWLLSKALENGSLRDAVRLAREADEFVARGRDDKAAGTATGGRDGRQTEELERNGGIPFANPPGETVERPLDYREPSGGQPHPAFHGQFPNDATGATVTHLGSDEGNGVHTSDEAAPSNGDADLAVLAGAEDIIRYLRQRDDVVVRENGFFLVNGRFRLSLEELLARANKMRLRQGKPLFQQMPLGFPQERRLPPSSSAVAAE
ncbi:MAG: hypothetical protein WB697_11090 [Stellaceae bacterium]